jgi:hypothetical protein
LAWFYERWVCEEGVDDATEHQWSCWEGFEVAVPVFLEVGAEGVDFGVCWSEFGTDI